jgi:hypothetical protein
MTRSKLLTQLTVENLAADFRAEAARVTSKIERTYKLQDLPASVSVVATNNPSNRKPTGIALVHQALSLRATATGQLHHVDTLLEQAREDYSRQVFDTVEISEANALVRHFQTALEWFRSASDVNWFTVTYKLTGFLCTTATLTVDYGWGKYGGWGKLENGKETRYYLDLGSVQQLTAMLLPALAEPASRGGAGSPA